MEQPFQSNRILSMYDRLKEGHFIIKKEEADFFGVSEKTIQRDIESIRRYLETAKTNEYLEYNRKEKAYQIEGTNPAVLENEEIFVMTKILIESRAFPKEDMHILLDKLTDLAQPMERQLIQQLISNEKFLYADLQHKKTLFGLIWDLAKAVQMKKILKITYQKENGEEIKRELKAVGMIFSEYYFYLIAYDGERESTFPKVYRIDRITTYKVLNRSFKVPYHHRFQEGEFRKRIQFMHAGELMKIRFKFTGPSTQAVLDRLPTAEVVSQDKSGVIFEAEVYGHGIKMWLLSQGEYVEVLSPQDLREEMKALFENMIEKYT